MNKSIFLAALVAVSTIAAPVAAQQRGSFADMARPVSESAPRCVFRQEWRTWAHEFTRYNRYGEAVGVVWRQTTACNQQTTQLKKQTVTSSEMSRPRHSLEYVLRHQNGSGVACIDGLVHLVDSPTDIKLPAGGAVKLTCHIADG